MPNSPAQTHRAWSDAFGRGDVDALMDLYEDDAVAVAEPGAPLTVGKPAIREAVTSFVSMGATFELLDTQVLEGGGLALVYSSWRLSGGSGPDGNPLDMTGQTTDVMRRQGDGSWRFVIDNPYGVQAFATAPAGAA